MSKEKNEITISVTQRQKLEKKIISKIGTLTKAQNGFKDVMMDVLVLKEEKAHKEAGYGQFGDYIYEVTGMSPRMAYYLCQLAQLKRSLISDGIETEYINAFFDETNIQELIKFVKLGNESIGDILSDSANKFDGVIEAVSDACATMESLLSAEKELRLEQKKANDNAEPENNSDTPVSEESEASETEPEAKLEVKIFPNPDETIESFKTRVLKNIETVFTVTRDFTLTIKY